jgi:hypothetical protein
MTTKDPAVQAVVQEMSELEKLMTQTRRRLANGDLHDISGLTTRAQRFLDKALALEVDQRVTFAHKLGAIQADIELLAEQKIREQAKQQAAR